MVKYNYSWAIRRACERYGVGYNDWWVGGLDFETRRKIELLAKFLLDSVNKKEPIEPKTIAALANGVYRVTWVTEGSSIATMGRDEKGQQWLAPTDWARPALVSAIQDSIADMECVLVDNLRNTTAMAEARPKRPC